ncbi:Uncharacterised protein [Salmonella enterica subsp. enterica serovar Bovismorbificans]|uniref:Uncharacterized protein n=1 Tax=Salmonella enterica subsp. enterica serovar Bovismorbificans TaxID=58097 RepID=A0A655BZI6_SALET|nr:Uncharacterised protein [Salmonella enterica subsp. enterica serovar Bovismorbificans]
MRFVMFKELITEGFSFGVKHHRSMRRLILHDQAAQHVEDTIHCARRFSRAVG